MTGRSHTYDVQIEWTGDLGDGTNTYSGYSRDHAIKADGKPVILGSSDPSFRGDPVRWNPEELLVASLSACHKLWYLSLCASYGVNVLAYEDQARGVMTEEADGAGQFHSVDLHPRVTLRHGSDEALASSLHDRAHQMCFIARSVCFPVSVTPTFVFDVLP